ncbi:hypothetical protein ABZV14_45430 [Streptosporangium canum]|uniref:hypothetical protein n=1 Tax=Streptosporangium canum TaxID=324952 RepID=UPI0033B78B00
MTDARFMVLRAAAAAGDLGAAREHARLAALLREEEEVAEERLRALAERLPHDSAVTAGVQMAPNLTGEREMSSLTQAAEE